MATFQTSEFYENICLSLMSIKIVESSVIRTGLVKFEADDFDDVDITFEWLAVKASDFNTINKDEFYAFKLREGWAIGFKKESVNDNINNLVLIDDSSDQEINKENTFLLIKGFIHENFLWEDDVLKQISI